MWPRTILRPCFSLQRIGSRGIRLAASLFPRRALALSRSRPLGCPVGRRRLSSSIRQANYQSDLNRGAPDEVDYDHPDDQSDATFYRQLWKHVLFAGVVGVATFSAAAYWEHRRRQAGQTWHAIMVAFQREYRQHRQRFSLQPRELREQIERFLHIDGPFSPGQKVVAAMLAAHLGIFAMWSLAMRMPHSPLATVAESWFLHYPPHRRYLTYFTSLFSHASGSHLLFNSFALWTFGAPIIDRYLGPEQFLALYLTGGVVASLASVLVQTARGRFHPSLGASGAIFSIVGLLAAVNPTAQVSLFFVFPMELQHGVAAAAAFDVFGLLFWRASRLDHAAHLGGLCVGLVYALWGAAWWARRDILLARAQRQLASWKVL